MDVQDGYLTVSAEKGLDMVLCLVITALLYRPLSRYFAPQETVAAVKRNQGPEL